MQAEIPNARVAVIGSQTLTAVDPTVPVAAEKERGEAVGIPRLQLDKVGDSVTDAADPLVPEAALDATKAVGPLEEGGRVSAEG